MKSLTNDYANTEYSQSWTPESAERNELSGPVRFMRRVVFFLGIAIFILGVFAGWRAFHPPVNDEEQIKTQLEEMRAALESRKPGPITSKIGEGFTWNGVDARQMRAAVAQSLMQWREVRCHFEDIGVVVSGDSAASQGNYTLQLRETPDAKPETYIGTFSIEWKKSNGKWEMAQAQGGENLPGIGEASESNTF